MHGRGALLHFTLFVPIDSGKKAIPDFTTIISKFRGYTPLWLYACKIQVIIAHLLNR